LENYFQFYWKVISFPVESDGNKVKMSNWNWTKQKEKGNSNSNWNSGFPMLAHWKTSGLLSRDGGGVVKSGVVGMEGRVPKRK
jgi:hypothetical protein